MTKNNKSRLMISNKAVAIIPARGGSKRIPGKNIKPFCGKPLLAYSIEAAMQSGCFDRVIVSTDSDRVAKMALRYGAEVPFRRPTELSGDRIGTAEVLVHALKRLAEEEGSSRTYACCIYATAPMLKPEYLRKGMRLIKSSKASTVLSVTTYPYSVFRALERDEGGWLRMHWPENIEKRSQDLPEALHDAGQFYWVDVAAFLKERKLFSRHALPVMLPREIVQDIDTKQDWIVAERLFRVANRP